MSASTPPPAASLPTDRILRAILAILLSVACFSVLNAMSKTLSQTYPVIEVIWARYFFAFLLMLALFLPRSPLNLTALSARFLQEPVGRRRWAAVCVGFIGALIVVRPGQAHFDWHALLIVGSTLCSALYQLYSRR